MEHLVRTTLNLYQFKCIRCGKYIYINEMDIDIDKYPNIICPFCGSRSMYHGIEIHTEIKEVKDGRH